MKTKLSSITNPIHTLPFSFRLQSVLEFLTLIYTNSYSRILHLKAFMNSYGYRINSTGAEKSRLSILSGLKNKLPKFDFQKIIKFALPVFAILLLVVVGRNVYGLLSSDSQQVEGSQVTLEGPVFAEEVDKEFMFPVEDEEEVSEFQFDVESIELRREIVVKGQRATSVSGRIFLIVNLKIKNDFEQALSINTRDYVRIVLDGNEDDVMAPDIHSDPVEVQAISTKRARVGLAIDDTVGKVTLRIGEIGGEKEDIEVSLNN